MSAPAANAFSLPVMTMQPMPSSASKPSSAAESSSISWALSALRALGRLSRTMPTRPLVSTMMVWYAMACSIFACKRRSMLAGGAIEGRTPALGLAAHPAPASRPRARRAVATVDGKVMLEAAKRAVGLLIVAQRRAPGGDRIVQHRLDRSDQSYRRRRGLSRPRCQPSRTRVRREAGAEQCLAHVDV